MKNLSLEQVIFDGSKVSDAVFTVTAATDLVTSAAHGFTGGELVQLTTATTLPAGLSLATNYYVINPTTDTFQLSVAPGGSAVDITDTGTGAHTLHVKGRIVYVGDWEHLNLSLNFISTPTMAVKFQGSHAIDAPNFNAAQAYTNRWDYLDVTDEQNGTSVDGDTGVACAGTADDRLFSVSVKGLTYLTAITSGWSAGKIDLRAKMYN
jgi:hypothetical protein